MDALYTQIGKISEGRYCQSYMGKHKTTGEMAVIKKIRMLSADETILANSRREANLLYQLKHPNILELKGQFINNVKLFLIYEYLSMDLKTYLSKLKSDNLLMDPATVKNYMYQINNAIVFCHQSRIKHGNLKPQNVFIQETGIIKLADIEVGQSFGVPVRTYSSEVVAPWYRAPEVLLGSPRYSYPIDMWALGCIFAEMSSTEPLFRGDCEIDQLFRIFRVLRTPTNEIWSGVSSMPYYKSIFPKWHKFDLHNHVQNIDGLGMCLLQKMLTYDPAKRISSMMAYLDQYFRDVTLPPGLATKQVYKSVVRNTSDVAK